MSLINKDLKKSSSAPRPDIRTFKPKNYFTFRMLYCAKPDMSAIGDTKPFANFLNSSIFNMDSISIELFE